MRCFIAASIPEKIKDHLQRVQTELRRAGLKASWVKREAIHLTLIFLGEVNQEQAQKTASILKNLSSQTPVQLKLSQLNAFPNLNFPKVVWLSLEGKITKLKLIDNTLRNYLVGEKIPFDPKPFVPHLTLARLRRVKPPQRKQINQILKQFTLNQKPSFKITQIALIKSQLTPQGPIYTLLEKLPLH